MKNPNQQPIPRTERKNPAHSPKGFALVVTLSMMVLLVLIGLGMLSLSAVSLRTSSEDGAMRLARANARMAMVIAIGKLQAEAGVDRAVTATAAMLGENVENPHWTGVWKEGQPTAWLVSHSENPDPEIPVSGDSAVLQTQPDGTVTVRAPYVDVTSSGRFAWWVADEGVKTRVDSGIAATPPKTPSERLARAASAQQPGLIRSSDSWTDLDPEINRSLLVSLSTAALAAGEPGLPRDLFHDFTTGGYGLPVNVKDGGMKVDISTVFDESDPDHGTIMETYCGSIPTPVTVAGTPMYSFSEPKDATAMERFFLAPTLTSGGTKPVGPNWGILYNQAKQHNHIVSGRALVSGAYPTLGTNTDLRKNDWSPYASTKLFANGDSQHVSSGVRPVISTLQMGFRLSARLDSTHRPGDTKKYYWLQMQVKPLVGFWNPQNIALAPTTYSLEWAVYPYFRLGLEKNGTTDRPQIWMRDLWQTKSGGTDLHSRWFRLNTEMVDFEPGEFRYFSINEKNKKMIATNIMYPTWSRDGAYAQDLYFNASASTPPGKAGQAMILEEGTLVSVEDMFLEDTQDPITDTYYGGIPESSTPSWVSLKTAGAQAQTLSRWTGTWVSGKSSAGWSVPEKLVNTTSAPKYSVEQLAASHEHIGTWSMKARTTTEAQDMSATGSSTQAARGTVDANMRALVANPLWDGSRSASGDFDGWWFLPGMIGGGHSGSHSDGGPNGRGLVARGSAIGDETPQVQLPLGGRFQGYGGPSSGPLGGQTHVAVIDVPRGPPVSLGALQYADLGRYNFEPTRVVGNSYANVRIPLGKTVARNFAGFPGFDLVDISYEVNERLWDSFFFSTIAPAYAGGPTTTADAAFPISEIANGRTPLPNPRLVFLPREGDTSLSEIKSESNGKPAEAIASRISVVGAFNVNSTSKDAWKAQLASMADVEFPVVSPAGIDWEEKSGLRVTGSRVVIDPSGYRRTDSGADPQFWQSYRAMDETELDELAEEIVKEVRARGPFLSLSAFVNRDPEAANPDFQRKGALQAALDRTLNSALPISVGKPTEPLSGTLGANGVIDPSNPENQSAGHAGYAMQGDLLDALGSVIQVRSDYFRIRAVGETLSKDGTSVIARAVCEAFVQRTASYLDGADAAETAPADLISHANEVMGRRFEIVSFRWLNPKEI